MLPKSRVPLDVVTVGDEEIPVRGLTRGELMTIRDLDGGRAETEIVSLAYGTDTPVDETRDWYAAASSADVEPILGAIIRLSGLDDETPKGTGGTS